MVNCETWTSALRASGRGCGCLFSDVSLQPILLLQKRLGLFVGIVCGAVLQFAFGFVPEFVFAPFRLSGLLPKLVCANPYLFFGRFGHWSAFSRGASRFKG